MSQWTDIACMYSLQSCLRPEILSQLTSQWLIEPRPLLFWGTSRHASLHTKCCQITPWRFHKIACRMSEWINLATEQFLMCAVLRPIHILFAKLFASKSIVPGNVQISYRTPPYCTSKKYPTCWNEFFFAQRILLWNYDRHASLHSKCWHIAVILARPHYNQSEYSSIVIKKCSTGTRD